MTNTDISTTTEVHIRVARDDDASRIAAVLEALGYNVLRQLDEGDGPQRLRWAVTRLARRHKLTSREQDILELVLEGRSNEQIGRVLEISRATVKWHMHNVFAKTNSGNRESLLRLALQLGSGGDPIVEPLASKQPMPAQKSSAPVLSAAGRTQTLVKRSDSNWAGSDDVTARIEFDQPRVPTADSIPSKSWF
ncbi:helix-turn-helix domain-containing protein [Enhygromyxa salina]|uniref:helix-turn-helix domain-containing protein n=1 Tax=Enhygromyxa salina TaxID=215803 RepID=UPI001FD4AADB|nr:helix-turn-helix transcriptional regulator [Enhygromyxa salina]